MMFRQNTPATADLFESIRADVFTAMEQFGGEVVAVIQEKISVDVEYTTGPRGGVRVIRSLPGKPPRRETGNLQQSYQSAVETDAEVVTLEVFSDVPYAAHLENGTARVAQRPHVADTADEMAEAFFDRVTAAFAGQ
jgi:hypothetical protein